MSHEIMTKDELLMNSLTEFYSQDNCKNMITMLAITGEKTLISGRILDYFVTIYAQKKDVAINGNNLHMQYKTQLKGVTKDSFDAFRRRSRLNFYYDPNDVEKYVETTIGQLMFYRWAIKNGIINYVENNFDDINSSMLIYMADRNEKRRHKQQKQLEFQKADYKPPEKKRSAAKPVEIPVNAKKSRVTVTKNNSPAGTEIVVTF